MRGAAAAAPADELPAAQLIDLDRYPIGDLAAPAMRDVLGWARAQLRDTGACEVPGFLGAAGLAAVAADAEALSASAYRSEGLGTAYLEVPDFSLPDDHPRRYFAQAAVGVVAYDTQPGTCSTELLRLARYGRVA
jgi:hypothetical protein